MPTVSVILPTYNRAHLLPQAITTVLQQTYHDFELIIVDDGSTDNTYAVIQSFSDPRLIYLRHEENRGVAAARNTGIGSSIGDYIAFQDSDDQWYPIKLARQLEVFAAVGMDTGVVFSQFRLANHSTTYLFPPTHEKLDGFLYNRLLRSNFITTQTALVRRAVLNKIGLFNEALPCLVDWELWLRLARTYRFHYVPEPLVTVYTTSSSISRDPAKLAVAREYILTHYLTDLQQDKRLLAHHFYVTGHLFYISNRPARGRTYLFNAIKHDPFAARYWLTSFISLLGVSVYAAVYSIKSKIWPGWY